MGFKVRNKHIVLLQVSRNYPKDLGADWFGCHSNGRLNIAGQRELAVSRITDNATILPEIAPRVEDVLGDQPPTLANDEFTEFYIPTSFPLTAEANRPIFGLTTTFLFVFVMPVLHLGH